MRCIRHRSACIRMVPYPPYYSYDGVHNDFYRLYTVQISGRLFYENCCFKKSEIYRRDSSHDFRHKKRKLLTASGNRIGSTSD